MLCQHISLFSFPLASKSLAQSFTYVSALLRPIMGQCVNNLHAGKPNIHTLHRESYRVVLMNFMRGRAEETLRFGTRIATSKQNHLMNLCFSTRECSLHSVPCVLVARDTSSFSKKRHIPLEKNLHLQWLYLPFGEAHLWPLTTGEA